jgi:hypothetical protein
MIRDSGSGSVVKNVYMSTVIGPGLAHDVTKKFDLVRRTMDSCTPMICDITVRSVCTKTIMAKARIEGAEATIEAERRKWDQYGAVLEASNLSLEVLSFEHYGRLGTHMVNLILECASNATQLWTKDSYGWNAATQRFSDHWFQRLSCQLQKQLGMREIEIMRLSCNPISIDGSTFDHRQWATIKPLWRFGRF